MRYKWKPNIAEKNDYIKKIKEKESLNTFTTNKTVSLIYEKMCCPTFIF